MAGITGIDILGTIRRLVTAVGLIPTTAMRGTDGAALAVNYTAARAAFLEFINNANLETIADISNFTATEIAYLDELAAANLPSDIDDLLANLAKVYWHPDSRMRVYPRVPSSVIQIAAAAAADTWGSWTQVIPINTVDFLYHPVGVMIEQVGAGATYIIQFGYSTADGDDPTTAQIVGEQRFKALGTPLKTYHADLQLFGRDCPSNSKLWARTMTESVNADTCDISITLTRHIEVTNPVAYLTTWPWAS